MTNASRSYSPVLENRSPSLRTDSERRRHAAQGFTLIELLAALLILATAFTVALPALTAGSATEIKAVARIVAAGLRQTRDRAITANRPTVMEFDVRRKRIMLGTRSRQLPQRARVGLFTARSERIDASRGAIRFFSDGSSTGGRVTLAMDNRRVLVDVDWLTGRVSILKGKPGDLDAPAAFEPVRIE